MLIRTKNPNPNLQKNQTKCVHLTTVRLYTTAPPLNNPHPSAGLLATEQPKEGLVMLKQGTGRRPLFKPKLDTVAERTWLKTPAGSA